MAAATKKRDLGWLPTFVVLVVVLVAGSRLIWLSVQHHAALARDNATSIAGSFVRKIEPQLWKLADLAARQAASAARAMSSQSDASLSSVPLAPDTFWMNTDDSVLGARATEAATASGVSSEWQSVESTRAVPGSSLLGPLRLGSEWLLAVRVPIMVRVAGDLPQSRGWSVAYGDLDELLADSHLARLSDMGYEF